MSALKGDFISFSFNGVHSSELGIVRTSDGSRFNENLLPTIQDKTVQVPGGDGTYFFGSYYTQRQFNVPIAFDSLTEEQVGRLYSHFGDKQIHELIFDERPYKYYMAKITGTPQIKTICFEVNGKRIYKGEGTLNFICYYPYAKSKFKYLDQYNISNFPHFDTIADYFKTKDTAPISGKSYFTKSVNGDEISYKKFTGTSFSSGVDYYEEVYWIYNREEWKDASRMLDTKSTLDQGGATQMSIYNCGDMETDFKLYFGFNGGQTINIDTLSIGSTGAALKINPIIKEEDNDDTHVCINTKTNLISGCKISYDEKNNRIIEETPNLYNSYIQSGDFFKIPITQEGQTDSLTASATMDFIEYDYIYF